MSDYVAITAWKIDRLANILPTIYKEGFSPDSNHKAKNYTVYAEVFDVWCPAGQLSVRITDQMIIKGNVYDDWHIAPTNP